MNKIAIVTGSSKGIGLSISEKLRLNNYIVIDTYNTTYKEGYIHLDISSEESCKYVIEQTYDTYGKIDLLVNNASVIKRSPFLETTLDEWNEVFRVNVAGTFIMSREALKIMKNQSSGSIINISSIAASTGGKYSIAYAASKAAIENLTKSIASEFAPKIRANTISPGRINTDMMPEKYLSTDGILLKRIGYANEVANAVLYLENNTYVTNTNLRVDGGMI